MKLLLVGGGTAGSAAPLLSVKQYLQKKDHRIQFLFFGTKSGVEKEMVEREKISYYSIPAGKWRRYFSIKNFFDIFVSLIGFFVAVSRLKKTRPDAMFAAGSFVSVPVAFAAKLLKIKIIIHQQDVFPSLSNRIIYPICDKLTVSLPESQKFFAQGFGLLKRQKNAEKKMVVTGNPIREKLTAGDRARAIKFFGLKKDLPVLLVLGGSLGADSINKLIRSAAQSLAAYFQIIHVTGRDKQPAEIKNNNYHVFEFLAGEMADALKIADIVVSRAGFSTITELSYCKKFSVIIPMPHSHQELNGQYLFSKRAAVVLRQDAVNPENFVGFLRKLIFEHDLQNIIKKNIAALMPRNAAEKIGQEILSII